MQQKAKTLTQGLSLDINRLSNSLPWGNCGGLTYSRTHKETSVSWVMEGVGSDMWIIDQKQSSMYSCDYLEHAGDTRSGTFTSKSVLEVGKVNGSTIGVVNGQLTQEQLPHEFTFTWT